MKGHTDSSFFSYECGAVVSQVGAGVTRLKIGDRVICQHPERFATTFAVPEDLCQPIQDDEDFEGMVGLQAPFCTAILTLRVIGHLGRGEASFLSLEAINKNLLIVSRVFSSMPLVTRLDLPPFKLHG